MALPADGEHDPQVHGGDEDQYDQVTIARQHQQPGASHFATYYSEELGGELRLDVLGKRLIVTVGNKGRFPLVELADNGFLSAGGAAFEFKRATGGQIDRFDYSSSRVRNLPFVRKADGAQP
jgi:hypothetical protein